MFFVGTCVDSFDENGDCLVSQLGWSDVSAFACAEENAETIQMSPERFAEIFADNAQFLSIRPDCQFLRTEDGVVMVYDEEEDIHYFFVGDLPEIGFSPC